MNFYLITFNYLFHKNLKKSYVERNLMCFSVVHSFLKIWSMLTYKFGYFVESNYLKQKIDSMRVICICQGERSVLQK